MNESDRLCNLIYALIFAEESRLQYEIDNSYNVLKQIPTDLHYIEKYKATVQRFEDFKIFSGKVIDLMRRF